MASRPQWILQIQCRSRMYGTAANSWPKKQREREMRDRFLRVDHAGEFGADRIYAGQMAVLSTYQAKFTQIFR